MAHRRREGTWAPPIFEKKVEVEVVHWWEDSHDLRRRRLKKKRGSGAFFFLVFACGRRPARWKQIADIRAEEPILYGPYAGRQTPGDRDDDGDGGGGDAPAVPSLLDSPAHGHDKGPTFAAQQALERFTPRGTDRYTPRGAAEGERWPTRRHDG